MNLNNHSTRPVVRSCRPVESSSRPVESTSRYVDLSRRFPISWDRLVRNSQYDSFAPFSNLKFSC